MGTMTHITEEDRTEVLDRVGEVRKWIEEKVGEQEQADVAGDPVFTSEEVPGQTKRIESIVAKLMKKKKPKPVEKKNETEAADKNETDATTDEDAGESSSESTGEDKEEEPVKAEEEAEAKEEDGAEKKDEKEGDEL